jgi:hypothetical protein
MRAREGFWVTKKIPAAAVENCLVGEGRYLLQETLDFAALPGSIDSKHL